jgi:hypothetical protein
MLCYTTIARCMIPQLRLAEADIPRVFCLEEQYAQQYHRSVGSLKVTRIQQPHASCCRAACETVQGMEPCGWSTSAWCDSPPENCLIYIILACSTLSDATQLVLTASCDSQCAAGAALCQQAESAQAGAWLGSSGSKEWHTNICHSLSCRHSHLAGQTCSCCPQGSGCKAATSC